ncbi:putative Smr domain-containing protein [Rosa chinensis]|uniref:Putative Smr domain-containing protein n=1 Tax=Rosa chinensis TaxID=74649 RepID=A0A2P6QJX2_ROSCH|nr:SMR domain-containing protein At5g58720 [Rosa chinensis]PRQ34485.1 putative Smr domain-containing protein [Rosa chinensis]
MKKQTRRRRKKSSPADPKPAAPPKDDAEQKAVAALTEAFSSVSVDDAVSALREAKGHPDKAADILVQSLADTSDEPFTSFTSSGVSGFDTGSDEPFTSSMSSGVSGFDTGSDYPFTSSSSSGVSGSDAGSTSGSGSSEGFESGCVQNLVSERGFRNKQKRVVASAGTVSNVLGKEYVRSRMTKLSGLKNGVAAGEEEAEQFLCSMLGDDSELNLAVVRDVLCQCGYDVEKALDCLLEVSSSLSEQPGRSSNYSYKENGRYSTGQFDSLTDRASDCTSYSSEDNIWYSGYAHRNYAEVLASSEAHHPMSPSSTKSNLPQKVLESLFNISKTPEYEPKAMNWKNVVNKLQSLGPEVDGGTSSSAEAKQDTSAKGDEYHAFRVTASQHWDLMKSYYQKAATAYSKGSREHAGYLSEQGRVQTKMAQKADEKASKEIFKARNKDIENMITIDLHGQHVKQAMKLLKIHLLFGTYAQSVQFLRVITGCGSHGLGKSKLKQSVIQLVENEGITWTEENQGVVLIKLGSHTEFNFMDSESDDE